MYEISYRAEVTISNGRSNITLPRGTWDPAAKVFVRTQGQEKNLVGAAGIEPATTGLENRCSIQLSYAPLSKIYHMLPLEYHAVSR